jgi:hypothetical protein
MVKQSAALTGQKSKIQDSIEFRLGLPPLQYCRGRGGHMATQAPPVGGP